MKWLLLLISTNALGANFIDTNCNQFVFSGAPVTNVRGIYLCKSHFAIHYNVATKTADYVVEALTKSTITIPRTNDFNEDDDIPEIARAHVSDFVHTKYDRGHLSAAANHSTINGMEESFLLTNIVPQNPNNNRGIWKHLETNIRQYVVSHPIVYIITGTHFTTKLYIGNKLQVPDYLYKVIVDPMTKTGIAFLIPNRAVAVKTLKQYAMPIQQLELIVHKNFMPQLTQEDRIAIETVVSNLNYFGE